MTDIAPINSPGAAAYSSNQRVERPASPAAETSRGADQVDLSSTARIFAQLNDTAGVRQDLVARVRAEIAAGTYETPEKLDVALEGLAEDLA